MARRNEFRQALLEAARQARSEGKLAPGDYAKLWARSFNKQFIAKAEEMAIEELQSEELNDPGDVPAQSINFGDIDWTKLVERIKKFIEIFTALSDLFGGLFGT
jgi:hypothetical protein